MTDKSTISSEQTDDTAAHAIRNRRRTRMGLVAALAIVIGLAMGQPAHADFWSGTPGGCLSGTAVPGGQTYRFLGFTKPTRYAGTVTGRVVYVTIGSWYGCYANPANPLRRINGVWDESYYWSGSAWILYLRGWDTISLPPV